MSMLDYGDIPYMPTSSQCIHALDTIYHGTLGFIISYNAQTYCCSSLVGLDGLLSPYTGLFTVMPSVVRWFLVCYHRTYAAMIFGKPLVAPVCVPRTYNCCQFSMSVLNWQRLPSCILLPLHGTCCKRT